MKYQSKYLDLVWKNETRQREKEKASILDDIDFELELIHRDDINVGYILTLLENMQEAEQKEKEKIHIHIDKILETEIQLRSKKELIERFISEHLTALPQGGNMRDAFSRYWDNEKDKAVIRMGEVGRFGYWWTERSNQGFPVYWESSIAESDCENQP